MSKQKQRQTGLGIMTLGVLILSAIYISLNSGPSSITGMAELIPANETAFFVEIQSGFKVSLPEFSTEPAWKIFLDDWPLKKAFALMKSNPSNNGKMSPVFIFETDAKNNTEELRKKYESLSMTIRTYRDYAFLSPNSNAIKTIELSAENIGSSLALNPEFYEIFSNLPASADAKWYAGYKFLQTVSAWSPAPFRGIGGTLTTDDQKNISMQGLATWNTKPYPVSPKRYEGRLLKFFPSSPILFIAGQNLPSHFAKNNTVLEEFTNRLLLLFQKEKTVSGNELARILSEEYALGVYSKPKLIGGVNFLIAVEIRDTEKHIWENIKTNLPETLSYLAPETRSITLKDGTKGKELFASPENITRHEESVEGKTVTVFETKNKPWNLFVTDSENILLISTNLDILKQSIAEKGDFRSGPEYKTFLEVLRGIHEGFFVQTDFLQKILGLRDYIKDFDSFSVGETYTENTLRYSIYAKHR